MIKVKSCMDFDLSSRRFHLAPLLIQISTPRLQINNYMRCKILLKKFGAVFSTNVFDEIVREELRTDIKNYNAKRDRKIYLTRTVWGRKVLKTLPKLKSSQKSKKSKNGDSHIAQGYIHLISAFHDVHSYEFPCPPDCSPGHPY